MKTFLIIIFISLFILNANTNANIDYTSHSNDTAYDCYITDIFDEGGIFYLKVRPIHFLSQLSAVIEAKKHGVADYIISNDFQDTAWFAPKDYYIDDRDKSELKLVISDKVKVSVYVQTVLKKINLNELIINPDYFEIQLYNINPLTNEPEKKEGMDYYPFEIAVIKGTVTEIRQVYMP